MRGARLAVPALAVGLTALVACVNPAGDFKSYQDRTADIRGVSPEIEPTGDGGAVVLPPIAGAAPGSNFESFYGFDCAPRAITADPAQALRFRLFLSYTGDATGGTVNAILRPLLAHATDLSQVDPAATEITGQPAQVAADGRVDIVFGTVNVPGSANPVSGGTIVVNDTVALGVFFEPQPSFCAQLAGQVTTPVVADLSKPPGTACVAQKYDGPSGPLPVRKLTDFQCPLQR